ncbi:nucleotidyltransferase family protein [Opitutus sp. ER46]|uniref:nucleotidyltransferase family protein n=1 Tax=Opitutus sp. ER46 TaxID=2161864 RepID=UPI000D3189C4|nr:nucleotidyltransferase family protein [Opitutus sp. ER46]PTX91503.1 4-diphosphocytidyl-2C-methyl-D-erythritol synthase [Opitutus sp. ER46]
MSRPDPAAPSARPPRVGAIILAAGASTRMGSPKQLLPIEGKPLLVRTVESALGAPVWPVIVVLGAHAEQIRPALAHLPVLTVENPAWPEGMASSIRAGITALQQFSRMMDAVVIALCDQPAFSSTTVVQLITAHRTTGRTIVAARYANRRGAPALFLREHFPALAALTGEEGARPLLQGDTFPVATVDLPELAVDLDSPADYASHAGTPPSPHEIPLPQSPPRGA